MSDTGEDWQAFDQMRREAAQEDRDLAAAHFDECFKLADAHGLYLVKHSESHYQLIQQQPRGWILNIYPGNGRLYGDKQRKPPFIKVPLAWSLKDVVEAAIETEKKAK